MTSKPASASASPASGGKSFLAQYTLAPGAKRRVPLGSSATPSPLASAREAARLQSSWATSPRGPRPRAPPIASRRPWKPSEGPPRDTMTLDVLIGQWASLRLADISARLYAARSRPRAALCLREANCPCPPPTSRRSPLPACWKVCRQMAGPRWPRAGWAYGRAASLGHQPQRSCDNPFADLSARARRGTRPRADRPRICAPSGKRPTGPGPSTPSCGH